MAGRFAAAHWSTPDLTIIKLRKATFYAERSFAGDGTTRFVGVHATSQPLGGSRSTIGRAGAPLRCASLACFVFALAFKLVALDLVVAENDVRLIRALVLADLLNL